MQGKKVILRFDVSPNVGIGHLRRCHSLASSLAGLGARVKVLCRAQGYDVEGAFSGLECGLSLLDWETDRATDAEILVRAVREGDAVVVLDHYRVDQTYQSVLLNAGVRWLQFDWAAKEPIWADWVVSPSPASSHEKYRQIVRKQGARLLLGPRYVILSPQFSNPALLRERDGSVRQVLILMGGGCDRGAIGLTLKAVEALPESLRKDVRWEIISGSVNPNLAGINEWLARNGATIKAQLTVDAADVAARIANADLAITAGGTVVYETAVLRCPSVIISIADNQEANAAAWNDLKTSRYLGPVESLPVSRLAECLASLLESPALVRTMSEAAATVLDAQGSERVARELLS